MTQLFPIVFMSLFFAYCADKRSKYDYSLECYIYKESFFWLCITVMMILFVGLRIRYNDTTTYIGIYEGIRIQNDSWQNIDWSIGSNPGFVIVNYILKLIGFSTQSFLLFYASITIGVYMWFIRKYTNNMWLSVFLFLTVGGFVFTLAAIKQCMAVAFCLIATDMAIEKKYIRFIIFIAIAVLFHPYSFMYLVVPFLMFTPYCKKTYIMIMLFLILGFSLERLLGSLVSATLIIGEGYSIESFVGEGVHPLRLAVMCVPTIMAFFVRNRLASCNDKINNLMINLTMLNAEIMFIALFGTANYFARLANYFMIFQALSIPWLLTHFNYKSRKILTIIAVICYMLFFYYENGIKDSFDYHFSNITLLDYLLSIL